MKIHTLPLLDAVSASRKVPVYKALREEGMNAKWEKIPKGVDNWNGPLWYFGVSVDDLDKLGLEA